MNRPAYEFTTAETIFMFVLIPVAYFGLIGLIYLEIKLTRKKFFDKMLKYWLQEEKEQ